MEVLFHLGKTPIGYVIRIDALRQREMNEVKDNVTLVPPKRCDTKYVSVLKIQLINQFDIKLRSAKRLCFLHQLLKKFINNSIALIISLSRVLSLK